MKGEDLAFLKGDVDVLCNLMEDENSDSWKPKKIKKKVAQYGEAYYQLKHNKKEAKDFKWPPSPIVTQCSTDNLAGPNAKRGMEVNGEQIEHRGEMIAKLFDPRWRNLFGGTEMWRWAKSIVFSKDSRTRTFKEEKDGTKNYLKAGKKGFTLTPWKTDNRCSLNALASDVGCETTTGGEWGIWGWPLEGTHAKMTLTLKNCQFQE